MANFCPFELLNDLVNRAKKSSNASAELKFRFITISCEINGGFPFFQIQLDGGIPYEPVNSEIINVLNQWYEA